MTVRDHDEAFVRRALAQVTPPDHRPEFWADLARRLAAEPEAGRPAHDESTPIAELHEPGATRSRRWWVAAVAAVLVAVAGIAALASAGNDPSRVRTPAEPGSTTTAVPDTTTPDTAAEDAALEWLDLLAAGDMRTAWDRLGPTARDVWPSYEAFAGSRTAFAEGMALWASAEQRTVEAAAVTTLDGETIHVVTITGIRRPEGQEEHAAFAVVVRRRIDGAVLIEPFSPVSAGIRFTTPAPGARPGSLRPDEAVSLQAPDGDGDLFLVLDGEAVELSRRPTGDATYQPDGGWSSGRHVVTAVLVTAAGDTVAGAAVFDVA